MRSFKWAALLLIIAASFNLYDSKAEPNVDNSGNVSRSFKVNKGGTLKVSVNSGDVTIETWNKNEVYVRISDADDNQNNSLNIYQSGGTIIVQNNGSGYYNSSDVRVSVPVEFNLDLKSNQGDIIVHNELKGNCQISTGGGDVTLGNVTGYANLKTNGGDIVAGNINGDLVLSTNGGDVTVRNIYGKGDIQTKGGEISVGNVGKYLYVKTFGGDIVTGDIGGSADVSTMGGNISVKKVSGSAKLSTNGGDVKILGSTGSTYARTYGGNLYLYNISGSINASTSSGDIYAELRAVYGSSKLETMNGSVKFYIDPNAKATINVNVVTSGWGGSDEKPVISEFPAKSYDANKYSGNVNATYKINGGGDTIVIKTINDSIELRKLRK